MLVAHCTLDEGLLLSLDLLDLLKLSLLLIIESAEVLKMAAIAKVVLRGDTAAPPELEVRRLRRGLPVRVWLQVDVVVMVGPAGKAVIP